MKPMQQMMMKTWASKMTPATETLPHPLGSESPSNVLHALESHVVHSCRQISIVKDGELAAETW